MIPDDAFLRTLPNITDPTEAVHIEALVFSADTIESSVNAIRHTALHFKEKIAEAGRPVTVGMFTHAWAIIDCVHVIRQNIRAIDYQSERATSYLEKFECASQLRNKMDHLAQNAQNTANAKGRPPIFGSLAYVCIPDDKIQKKEGRTEVTGGGMVVLTTGRIANWKRISAVNPAGLQLQFQVGGFRLDAFEQQLELEDAADDTKALLTEMNENLEASIREQAAKAAAERNMAVEKLLEHHGGGLSLYLAFEAKGPTGAQSEEL